MNLNIYMNIIKIKINQWVLNVNVNNVEKKVKQLHYKNNKEKYKKAFQEFMIRNPDYYKLYLIKLKSNIHD